MAKALHIHASGDPDCPYRIRRGKFTRTFRTIEEARVYVAFDLKLFASVDDNFMPLPEPKRDLCPGCWATRIDCTEGCGARICTCNVSTHDCDTFTEGGE
jgi:hypothetical protein